MRRWNKKKKETVLETALASDRRGRKRKRMEMMTRWGCESSGISGE